MLDRVAFNSMSWVTFVLLNVFVILGCWLIVIVARCFLYRRLGLPSWSALVPIYRKAVLARRVGMTWVGIAIIVLAAIAGFVRPFYWFLRHTKYWALVDIVVFMSLFVAWVLNCVIQYRVLGELGRSRKLIILCVLCPVVYYPIVAATKQKDRDIFNGS